LATGWTKAARNNREKNVSSNPLTNASLLSCQMKYIIWNQETTTYFFDTVKISSDLLSAEFG